MIRKTDYDYGMNRGGWSRRRILFVLANLSEYRSGKIPGDARQTGYTDAPYTKHQVKPRAGFIAAVEDAAEATLRVGRAKKEAESVVHRISRARLQNMDDGALVMRVYADGWEARKIAQLLHCTERDVWYRINRALRYASSDDCLIVGYKEWCRKNHR